jgi:hypothetical protein
MEKYSFAIFVRLKVPVFKGFPYLAQHSERINLYILALLKLRFFIAT